MTRNKKIIIIVIVLITGWICFRTAVVGYSLYQDGWRLGDWQRAVAEVGDYIKYIINEIRHPKEITQEEITNQKVMPETLLVEYNQTRTDEQRKEAIEKIKAIFGEDLEIMFKEAKTRYYSCGIPDPAVITDFVQLKVIEVYEDNKGFTTEVDTETNEILKRWKDCTTETQWITADQAQKIAENLLAKLVDNPENYELVNADAHQKTYYTFWRRMHGGEFYSKIPGGEKVQYLSRAEDRFITICSLNGELMSYEYNYALTKEEVEEMAKKWEETQGWDIEAIRKVLGDPNAEFTFVTWITTGTKVERIETEEGTILESGDYKTFRVYRDENGYCYDVDEDRNVSPDTEVLKGCGGWKSPEEPKELTPDRYREIGNFNGSPEDIEKIREFIGKPEAKIIFVRNEIAEGKWIKIYREENDPCLLYGIDENGEIHRGREPIEGCGIP